MIEKNFSLYKKMLVLVTVFFFIISSVSCGLISPSVHEKKDKKLKILTSFFIPYHFTKKIVGDKAEVYSLVQGGAAPHDFEPSSADIQKLLDSDLFVFSGAGMEPWIQDFQASYGEKISFLDLSQKATLIVEDEEKDPHLWLSPLEAIKQIELIKDQLLLLDPINKNFYEENYQQFKSSLENLHQKYKESTSKYKQRTLLVSHKAFAYLCRDYDLQQVGIRGVFSHAEPSPRRMAELILFAKKENLKVVFFETLVSPKVAETIAQEASLAVESLNPLEGGEDMETLDYLSLMEKNLESLNRYYLP